MTLALQRLLTWLSPAFPVGAFAWSAGLETAIADGTVRDAAALQGWLLAALRHGGMRTDAIILAEAHRVVAGEAEHVSPAPQSTSLPLEGRVGVGVAQSAPTPPQAIGLPIVGALAKTSPPPPCPSPQGGGDAPRHRDMHHHLRGLADLATALTPSAERLAETTHTGDAFILAARAWPHPVLDMLPKRCPYPVAVGAIAAAHDVPLGDTLLAYVTAAVHGQVSVAVRLVPLGQTEGLRTMAALEPEIAALAELAAASGLDAIGGVGYATDIAQMRHETLEPRIFRS